MTTEPYRDLPIFALASAGRRKSIAERFDEFHSANPQVYYRLRKLAIAWCKRNPDTTCSISMLYEVIRYAEGMRGIVTADDNPFKLNNDFRSRYARMIEDNTPICRGRFETRRLRA